MSPGYLYLAIHIAGSVAFGHVMKWALRRNCGLVAVGAVNYVVAAALSLAFALLGGSVGLTPLGIGIGLVGGLSYVVSYYFYYQSIRLTGVSVSTAVVRLSVLPAVVASIALWAERPAAHQVIGILLVLVALPLLSQQPGDKAVQLVGPVWGWLLLLFVSTSGGPIAAKVFQESGTPLAKPFLLAVWFGIAAVVAIGSLGAQRLRPTRHDLPLGMLLGVVNVVGNFAMLAALDHLPGAIVFPASSAGGVLLVVITSAALWREQLGRLAFLGVLVAVPSLVLMNLP